MGGTSMSAFQCCFCGKPIDPRFPDPVVLTIALPDGAEQRLYCHWEHLREAVHPSVPLYIWEGQ